MSADPAPTPLRLAFLGDARSVHLRRWMTFFADRGHSIHLLVPHREVVPPEIDARVHVRRFTAWPKTPIKGTSRLVTMLALRRAVLAVRPDIVHAHYLTRYGWAANLSGFRPYLVTVWGSDIFLTPKVDPSVKPWDRRALAGAALITAVTEDLARGAIEMGARPELTRIVQFGVEADRFTPGPRPEALVREFGLEGRRVVLSPRGLSALYRHETVVRALALLPKDVVVAFIRWEPDLAYLAELERLAAELGVAERMRFLPPASHDSFVDYLRLADVVVSVPRTDAFPVTTLEAMAVGVPVVMSDVPSAHEGFDAVDPTAIVDGTDPAAVAAAVLARLEMAPADRAMLAERMRAAAIERGETTRSLLEMEGFYREVLARRRRR